MKKISKKVVVGIPLKQYDTLKELAEESGRTIPGYVRWLIWKHLEEMDISAPLFPQGED